MTAPKKTYSDDSPPRNASPQIDTGYFHLFQDTLKVGELLVTKEPDGRLKESWITYGKAGTDGTTAVYLRPSETNTTVTTKFVWKAKTANFQTVWQNAKSAGLAPVSEQGIIDKNTTTGPS